MQVASGPGSGLEQARHASGRRTPAPAVPALALLAFAAVAIAGQTDIVGPPGSVSFGASVTVLPNGNIVIVDPDGPDFNRGTVYLYDPDGTLISSLAGSSPGDRVGSGGITVLANGNYVISSPAWRNGDAMRAGAATWAAGDTGASGVVSASNSLVGDTADDAVGGTVLALPNGNFLVTDPLWDNGTTADAGAVTWGNGGTGIVGVVSELNSLVGTSTNDHFITRTTVLANGNYVVASQFWDSPGDTPIVDAGAAVWGDGAAGTIGAITSANALIGTRSGDRVGSSVVALTNGNYVVASPGWNLDESTGGGAITWGNGTVGTAGAVSIANSFVGSAGTGVSSVTALANGHYVIRSLSSNLGINEAVGAVTWANGTTVTTGTVTVANSLYYASADAFFTMRVAALTNGHYVVYDFHFDHGAIVDAGAFTWANGFAPTSGVVSSANSMIGQTTEDRVGSHGVVALANGNYVVVTPFWSNADLGAVTWANGNGPTVGIVSSDNSLVGSSTFDLVGNPGVIALANGNYVVSSGYWTNGGIGDAGAVTWGNGAAGTVGVVSPANSLVGSTPGDNIGGDFASFAVQLRALPDGNYLVGSPSWDSPSLTDAGAMTWGNGLGGTSGTVSAANSLIGTAEQDRVGFLSALVGESGGYAFLTRAFDYAGNADVGAATLANYPLTGTISPSNSVIGTVPSGGSSMTLAYDATRARIAVGRPASNIVTLFDDGLFVDGFE